VRGFVRSNSRRFFVFQSHRFLEVTLMSQPPQQSNHFDPGGNARMVDITAKPVTVRTAKATGSVTMQPATAEMIRLGTARKGDVLGIARIAAITATKLTPALIPLCHGISVEAVDVRFWFSPESPGPADEARLQDADPVTMWCEAEVRTSGKTGVEMEALTAVMAGCLTVYDMCKSVDRGMVVSNLRVVEKAGGASGRYLAAT
jgi:cyclic pyranopterin phosphate synthase